MTEAERLGPEERLRLSLFGQLRDKTGAWDDRALRRAYVHMQVRADVGGVTCGGGRVGGCVYVWGCSCRRVHGPDPRDTGHRIIPLQIAQPYPNHIHPTQNTPKPQKQDAGQPRAFYVKLVGEGVDDHGGPYRAVFETAVGEEPAGGFEFD